MNIRKTLLAVALAGSFAAPLAARAEGINFNVDVAPPAPVYEQMPAREGYVVTPGYYKYDQERHAHTWVKGEYQPARKDEHYVAPEWKQQDGRYGFSEGRWEHDKGQ
jgi:hypothetical protein